LVFIAVPVPDSQALNESGQLLKGGAAVAEKAHFFVFHAFGRIGMDDLPRVPNRFDW
jgi:hypothetical protein